MGHEFKCQHCSAVLPAYLADDRCPECHQELDSGTPDRTRAVRSDANQKTDANQDVTIKPTRSYSASPQSPEIGEEFGDYVLVNEIARGGMGVVFRARQKGLDRLVALKMILEGQFASQLEIDRFKIEAQSAAHLDHPGIVPIYDIGEVNGKHYFSMALVEGQSLAERIAAGPLAELAAAKLLMQVVDAMHYAHQRGIIHRDLKPENILIDQNGQPRITDFGLAKRPDKDRNLTVTGQTLGTPSYMSPEQAGGREDTSFATDVYALGAILYAMLSGAPPFRGSTLIETLTQVIEREPTPLRQDFPNINPDIETICLKCLEKDPIERYATAGELLQELERFINGEPIEAVKLSPWGKFKRWRRIIRRNRDVRLRSAATFMGYPVVDIAYGRDTEAGETQGHAKGVIAFGDKATGLFAFGGFARGLFFAYGMYAVGLVSFGFVSCGLLGFGMIALGIWSGGGLSIGIYAFGAVAIGYKVIGFIGIGFYSLGAYRWQWFKPVQEALLPAVHALACRLVSKFRRR